MKQIQLTYHEENGYLYPDLTLPEQTHHPIGKYGDLYLAFIKAHRKGTYTTLLTTGKLNEHLLPSASIHCEASLRTLYRTDCSLSKCVEYKIRVVPLRFFQS